MKINVERDFKEDSHGTASLSAYRFIELSSLIKNVMHTRVTYIVPWFYK